MLAIGRTPTTEDIEQSFAKHHTVKGLAKYFGLTKEYAYLERTSGEKISGWDIKKRKPKGD